MPDLTHLLDTWGYVAIFAIVILGNLGLPVPEETVLTISGYLAWQGQLRFSLVALVGVVSAVAGDNMAYWLGRRYGQRILGRLAVAAPDRVERARAFVLRYGMHAVFIARFVAGLRFMAGPLAGCTGLGPWRFFIANFFGALIYVPVVVAAGYAIGYGFGDRIERFRRAAGVAERVALIAVAVAALTFWIARSRRHSPDS
ncbi:MAG TPA: DedA family protein [Candidatus Methylomirabilis sp.]|nr:DedA family protein [Candidatus Methylomirabilis sp.]